MNEDADDIGFEGTGRLDDCTLLTSVEIKGAAVVVGCNVVPAVEEVKDCPILTPVPKVNFLENEVEKAKGVVKNTVVDVRLGVKEARG